MSFFLSSLEFRHLLITSLVFVSLYHGIHTTPPYFITTYAHLFSPHTPGESFYLPSNARWRMACLRLNYFPQIPVACSKAQTSLNPLLYIIQIIRRCFSPLLHTSSPETFLFIIMKIKILTRNSQMPD